jgi:hypothetical protein
VTAAFALVFSLVGKVAVRFQPVLGGEGNVMKNRSRRRRGTSFPRGAEWLLRHACRSITWPGAAVGHRDQRGPYIRPGTNSKWPKGNTTER